VIRIGAVPVTAKAGNEAPISRRPSPSVGIHEEGRQKISRIRERFCLAHEQFGMRKEAR
jgi:hypothetical protein